MLAVKCFVRVLGVFVFFAFVWSGRAEAYRASTFTEKLELSLIDIAGTGGGRTRIIKNSLRPDEIGQRVIEAREVFLKLSDPTPFFDAYMNFELLVEVLHRFALLEKANPGAAVPEFGHREPISEGLVEQYRPQALRMMTAMIERIRISDKVLKARSINSLAGTYPQTRRTLLSVPEMAKKLAAMMAGSGESTPAVFNRTFNTISAVFFARVGSAPTSLPLREVPDRANIFPTGLAEQTDTFSSGLDPNLVRDIVWTVAAQLHDRLPESTRALMRIVTASLYDDRPISDQTVVLEALLEGVRLLRPDITDGLNDRSGADDVERILRRFKKVFESTTFKAARERNPNCDFDSFSYSYVAEVVGLNAINFPPEALKRIAAYLLEPYGFGTPTGEFGLWSEFTHERSPNLAARVAAHILVLAEDKTRPWGFSFKRRPSGLLPSHRIKFGSPLNAQPGACMLQIAELDRALGKYQAVRR